VDLLPRHFEIRAAGHDHAYLRILITLLFFIIQWITDWIRGGESPGNALRAAEAGFYRAFILVDGLNSAGNTTQKKPDEKAEQDSGKD
jgi:hypothetical protein